ncbi:S1 family peptidase [Halobacillus salinarum]|uniref:S1 family peptidase n=1 Tax=Halobacillus salinarum TaxID=2932257 RepID=UPI0029622A6A|nr:trypsin-like peptidase domain-containing protein [Halobacillus salinarum]
MGNPLKFTGIANEGTILDYTKLEDWSKPVLMLDAPVYCGNSGSPVINKQGEVIAVVFATMRDEEAGRVGLAVPIDYYFEKKDRKQNKP